MNKPKQQESLLVSDAIDVFGFGVVEVVCVSICHDGRHIVILALLLGSIRGNIEGDVFRVGPTCQELSIIIATGVDEDRGDPSVDIFIEAFGSTQAGFGYEVFI